MRRQQSGFTLVELSIVLVVIGLILGALSIGRDMQRNAEYMKVKQKFVDQWVEAYNSYYTKTGVVLGDSQVAPRYMVNGTAFGGNGPVLSGADMTEADVPNAICEGAKGQGMEREATLTLFTEMERHGIRMAPGRSEGREDRYVYLDSNGNPQELQVCFQWNPPQTWSNSGNVMVITGLTPDLARAIDQMIDGKPDAQEGMFRQEGIANGNVRAPGVEWGANNTQAYGEAGGAEAPGARQDEDQVITVVAHFKMTQ